MRSIRVYRIQRRKKPGRQDTFFSREVEGSREAGWSPESGPFFSPAPFSRRAESRGLLTEASSEKEEQDIGVSHGEALMRKSKEDSDHKDKGDEDLDQGIAEGKDCGKALNLEAKTVGDFRLVRYSMTQEKRKKAPEEEAEKKDFLEVKGKLKLLYKVDTAIHMPSVPPGLKPCQQLRVKQALKNQLLPHEKQHQRIMQGFAGTEIVAVRYAGSASGYAPYVKDLAMDHFHKRKDKIMAKSDALDPFQVTVDLCCSDQVPKKKKP